MQPKHLQALIDIQANNIAEMHCQIFTLREIARECAANYITYEHPEDYNEKEYCYKHISKLTRRIAKLVILQRALKEELSGVIFYDRFYAAEPDYTIGSNL